MRFYDVPRVIGIGHKPHVTTEAIKAAIEHARAQPIDRTSAVVGGALSYDGNGRPLDVDDSDAEILEAITIEVEYAQ